MSCFLKNISTKYRFLLEFLDSRFSKMKEEVFAVGVVGSIVIVIGADFPSLILLILLFFSCISLVQC